MTAKVGLVALVLIAAGCASQGTGAPPSPLVITLYGVAPGCARGALLDHLLAARYTIRDAQARRIVAGRRAAASRSGPPVIGGRLVGPSEERLIFSLAGDTRLLVTGAHVANLGTLFEKTVTTARPNLAPGEAAAIQSAVEKACRVN